MESRMMADSFLFDIHSSYLSVPAVPEISNDSERIRSMSFSSHGVRTESTSCRKPFPARSARHILPRLIWMAIGPGLMMALLVLKLDSDEIGAGSIDAGFMGVALSLIALRWGTWFTGDRLDSFGRRTTFRGIISFTFLVMGCVVAFLLLTRLLSVNDSEGISGQKVVSGSSHQ